METWLVIGISGVTNGGKTTLAKALYNYFAGHQNKIIFKENIIMNKVHLMCQDDYFLPADSPKHEVIEKLNHINWEVLSSLDMEKMCQDIMKIMGRNFILYNCQHASKPEIDNHIADHMGLAFEEGNIFAGHFLSTYLNRQDDEPTIRTTRLIKKARNDSFHNINIKLNVLLIEGFLIFNYPVTLDLCTIKFHLHLPYEKCYARRIQRVYDPPDVVGYFEMCVWPLYQKHFNELKDQTDIFTLNGEVPKENIFNYVLSRIKDML